MRLPTYIQPPALPTLDELLARAESETDAAVAATVPLGGLPTPQSALQSILRPYTGAPNMGPTGMRFGAGLMPGASAPGMPAAGGFSGRPSPTPLPGGGIPGVTGYTGGGTAPSGGYNGSQPMMNGQAGNAQDFGLNPNTLGKRGGVVMVRPALRDLAEVQKVTGAPVLQAVLGDGFRTREEQEQMYAAYLNGTGNLAAPPGSSMHEAGRAVDIDTSFLMQYPEVGRQLAKRGWVNAVSGEPWHWEYQGPATGGGRRAASSRSTSSGGGGGTSSPGSSTPSSGTRRRRRTSSSPAPTESQSRRRRARQFDLS